MEVTIYEEPILAQLHPEDAQIIRDSLADLRARLGQAEQAFKDASDQADELSAKLKECEAERDRLLRIETAAKNLYNAGYWLREGSTVEADLPYWDAMKAAIGEGS